MPGATAANVAARVDGSRFDVDGAVFFFTFLDASGAPIPEPETLRFAEAAAEAGAFLLGSSNTGLAPYLHELRRALDPNNVLNPGQLL